MNYTEYRNHYCVVRPKKVFVVEGMNYTEYRKHYCVVRQKCLCGGRDELYRKHYCVVRQSCLCGGRDELCGIQKTLLCRETNMSL